MSAYKTLQGFGGVKFELSGRSVTFDYLVNRGKLASKAVRFAKTTVNRKKIARLIGYETKITTELANLRPDDYLNFVYLAELIAEAYSHLTTITVYPRYDATSQYAVAIQCLPPENFSLEDIELYEAGQTLTLEWEAENLLDSVPLITNEPTPEYILAENGYFITDESGNKLLVEK